MSRSYTGRFEPGTPLSRIEVGATTTVSQLINEPIPDHAKQALIIVEDSDIRYSLDSNPPTETSGMLVKAGESIKLETENQIRRFSYIAVTASATMHITFFS